MKRISISNDNTNKVLISLSKSDELRQTKLFIDSISRGLADSEKGEVLTTLKLRKKLNKARADK
ncbi:MAG: hypothetical protein A2499_06790 [Stygiobacter sp. RIFOXYC12_FULL_38_8]|nr:MAG: hypothetical protein A2X62_09015 [Stygiobacter sp. GWC2_38_9]OGV06583.1 MAG: hypothetical protein A2299_02675 [Stygiobacter sp. RIFOXYB2_FULL_37_11]OGV13155.1 MAG: hypothetical protein A2440_12555 [Stygiobacter sp. RIFOXYC2_FULL_38_25]OGV17017.1 MAG: hypothetical protein A2237_12470 [Stygiobacter sp. RIFOXYA2_FULL_38_8]OGV29150.1 MAG: hypothetical protein A2499_06790 [Stygiobacter sp. RIFOXYC12_FULL_38_8]OGV83201.1 MAG: hypothetical protein A2X65_16110 [Stygiobacter sp. GWF2_38_21]RJQ